MSDELKNKSGKVKVMYVRSDDDSDRRTHTPRTVLTAVAALPAMNVTAAAMTANVTIVNAMISIVTALLRGVPSREHQTMMRR